VNISSVGEQRERGGEHEQHAEGRGDGGAVEEADAEREHAEQRDHDRGAGEEDRPAGRVHRQLERSLDVAAVLACLIACPPSSTCRVGERIVSAVLITWSIAAFGS
jgi:hypothetical protein